MVSKIERIAVVGSGLMGHAIALDFSLGGYEVIMNDKDEISLQRAMEEVRSDLDRMAQMKMVTPVQVRNALGNLSCSPDLREAVANVDFVVEAVFENLEAKQELFKRLDIAAPERAILASNTSSFMPSQVGALVKRLDKVMVTHYFNPAHLIPLVELVRGPETSDDTINSVRDLYTTIDKTPIVVEKEVIGFIVNRLQIALQREALWLIDNKVASPEDVDLGIKSSAGRRWAVAGPFEVMDLAGLDTVAEATGVMLPHISNKRDVSKSLLEKVNQGHLGTKTGQGFHTWNPEATELVRKRIAKALVEIERWSNEESKT